MNLTVPTTNLVRLNIAKILKLATLLMLNKLGLTLKLVQFKNPTDQALVVKNHIRIKEEAVKTTANIAKPIQMSTVINWIDIKEGAFVLVKVCSATKTSTNYKYYMHSHCSKKR